MKKFPYPLPELGFIVLVMFLPLLAAIIWRSESIWGFIGRLVVGMLVGFGIWFAVVFLFARSFDRKRKDQKT